MNRRLLPIFLLILTGILAACTSKGPFRDRGNDYLAVEPVRPLVFPEGERAYLSSEAWPIPSLERRRVADPGAGNARFRIPAPPALSSIEDLPASGSGAGQPVPEARVVQATDGNGHPVLMLDLDFDWAWQGVGDALRQVPAARIEDLDRGLGIYYLRINGKGAKGGGAYLLKLNYTANGIQVALQLDENAMAPRDVAEPLIESLREGLLKQ